MMTPTEKEELQEKLLLIANAAGRTGAREDRLLRDCQRYAFPRLTDVEIEAELLHLEKADLICTVEKTLRPDLRRWTTTVSGDRWLMTNGLI